MQRRKRANLSDLLNELTYQTLYNKFRMIAVTAFEWEGLPETILERHLEGYLFDYGKCAFFADPNMSHMCLPAEDNGQLNVYGDPLYYLATGFNYSRRLAADDCVIIENNPLRKCTHDFIMHYVSRLAEADRTMDINLKRCKTPYIIACDDKDVLTFKRIFQQIDGNVPAIYADKQLNLDALNVLKTEAKFLGNELQDFKKSIENELLTFLGFNNLAVDKKERVNVPEAESNNQITASYAELALISRQRAADAINKMFGLSVSVKRREPEPVEGVVDNVENSDVRHD